MRWQPTELRRLHLAAGLFLYALVCFFIYLRGHGDTSLFGIFGIFFLPGSIGAPFKRGLLAVGLVFGLMVACGVLLFLWFISFPIPFD